MSVREKLLNALDLATADHQADLESIRVVRIEGNRLGRISPKSGVTPAIVDRVKTSPEFTAAYSRARTRVEEIAARNLAIYARSAELVSHIKADWLALRAEAAKAALAGETVRLPTLQDFTAERQELKTALQEMIAAQTPKLVELLTPVARAAADACTRLATEDLGHFRRLAGTETASPESALSFLMLRDAMEKFVNDPPQANQAFPHVNNLLCGLIQP